ncbi:hypothetical protein GCM10010218_18840 [Streptomyces mashuensis]|uniref:Uncharacterized protein n=1 Tax=Streptomyces mashuensis TaxID=33904 RepID=A0A919B143_9ACTN|nr:hypothetical protein [Streptomyces mashuensis]GHF37937.1 hypothetical protein GCM10010218_18840 [Streptomyces mashuensis]
MKEPESRTGRPQGRGETVEEQTDRHAGQTLDEDDPEPHIIRGID